MEHSLLCPVCKQTLAFEEKRLVCPSGHSFDRAKQGYVNLLLSSKTGTHGDDRLMVNARRSFLEKGYYSRMRCAVNEALGEGNTVLDAGCGEGYYTGLFAEKNRVIGIDVSKEAVRSAAGKYKKAFFAVASVYELPVGDCSMDRVVNIFAPDSHSEYLRVLKRGGRLITVTPMADHLFELKSAVYEKPYKNPYVDPEREGFSLVGTTEVKYKAHLETNEDIRALFMMTPYYYNTSVEDRKKLDCINEMTVGLGFLICEYEKE